MVKPVWNNVQWVNQQNFAKKTYLCAKKNLVPRAVLMKSGLVSINTARQVNTAHSETTVNDARPMSYLSKTSHSTVKRPIHKNTTFKNNNIDQRVNIGNPQLDLQDQGVIDSGCSRYMTGNMSYFIDYEEINGGYVAFGGNPKGGKITGKVKGNLVRGLPSKLFENDQTCVACQKGKQHRASYDYSMFTWVFFLATKDQTSGILKYFITGIENLVGHKVKVIRCDNGTEFKNREMNQFCKMKGILRQFSIARTPQQNGVAERRNKTLIEAAWTMLADSKLPTTFWAEVINTACYVQNRVLVVKPHNKTSYKLFHGRTPTLSFMRPFGCPVTILNTIDHLGKFDGKAYEGSGPDWLFDIDALTRIMNYEPIITETQSNGFSGTKASDNAGQARKETEPIKDYILLPLWTADLPFFPGSKEFSR
ncbi:putative ribonuclease H-like domain-containing protein [Tanacetum coccineum]